MDKKEVYKFLFDGEESSKLRLGIAFFKSIIVDNEVYLIFQCVSRIQGTRKRQWPPSREEIMCTINRRLIYARFHFMDGQYHAIEFHSSASAADVVQIIKNKIGLRDSAMGA